MAVSLAQRAGSPEGIPYAETQIEVDGARSRDAERGSNR